MKNHYQRLISLTDQLVPSVLSQQNRDPETPEYGAFLLPEKGFGEPGISGNCADVLLSAYYAKGSRWYQNPQMLEAASLYLDNLLFMQHEDGTLDLRETNYHDATYVGFTVQILGYTWRMMEKYAGNTPQEAAICEKLHQFLKRSAHAMCKGGFHTPNHRWVLSSALSLCCNILGDEECRRQIDLYLGEGIDCDEYGEFTERSAGIYNVVNDRSLIIMARELNMPELLEHVRRNLDMMNCYIEPDFSVFTLNSRRQDNGKAVYPTNYYDCYLYMALMTGEPRYAWMAEKTLSLQEEIFRQEAFVTRLHTGFLNHLSRYLVDDELMAFEPELEQPVFDCVRYFPSSKIVRIRDENASLTLLGDNNLFCVYQKGHTKVRFRVASSFYAKGVFVPPSVEPLEDGGYRLTYSHHWGYTRPFLHGSPTSVWSEMDHASREHVNMMTMSMEVLAHKLEGGGVRLEVSVRGVKNLPSYVEAIFDADGVLETSDLMIEGKAGQSAVLTGREAVYKCRGEEFCLCSPYDGQQHHYTYNMRNNAPRLETAFTVYLTGMGETKRIIEIR